MERRCDVSIRECANGYIVDQRDGPVDPHRVAAGKMVFRDWESLTGWLAEHFSRPRPVATAECTDESVQALIDPMARPARPWRL